MSSILTDPVILLVAALVVFVAVVAMAGAGVMREIHGSYRREVTAWLAARGCDVAQVTMVAIQRYPFRHPYRVDHVFDAALIGAGGAIEHRRVRRVRDAMRRCTINWDAADAAGRAPGD